MCSFPEFVGLKGRRRWPICILRRGVFPSQIRLRFGRLRANELALNKRKVLDAARKHAQKGAKEKALKEYAKLLKEDTRDAKLLLEMGDAHRDHNLVFPKP